MIEIVLPRNLAQALGTQIERAAPGQVRLLPVRGGAASDPDLAQAEIALNGPLDGPASFRELIAAMPRLRWIHSTGAGINDFVSQALYERGVWVTNSAGVYAPAMGEYVLAMLVTVTLNLPGWLAAQREHRWLLPNAFPKGELRGKRLGIVGYGSVGRYLAGVSRALGMEVWACRRTPTLVSGEPVDRLLAPAELSALLEACDFVVIAASLNSTTRGLLGPNELRQMKRGAILVNVARGGIVEENALMAALRKGWLRAAVLDVTSVEPLPADSPLWDTPNLFLTPHISGDSPEGWQRTTDLFCANLRLYLDGHPERMGNLVDLRAHL